MMKKIPFLLIVALFLFACEREPVQPTTVKDHEGNVYKVKKYGDQTWMVENMKATTTKAGRNILKNPANGQFSYDEPMAYYMNDDVEYTTNKRGCLYNYAAAQQICPDGWHLPTVADWQTLTDYVEREYTGMYNGDTITVAKALALQGDWKSCDSVPGAPGYHRSTNNSSGFSLQPTGAYQTPNGSVNNPDYYNYRWRSELWSSSLTPYSADAVYTFEIRTNSNKFTIDGRTIFQGYSVRCVKDN
jgi:uncharacterized protein (TIGR02145 family)